MRDIYFVQLPQEIFSMASVWIRKGSASDPEGKEGLVHFFEHLFLSKTQIFSNKIEALQAIDGNGLFYNAFTSKDMTYFFLLQQPDRLQQAVRFLLEGIQNFDVDENDVDKERQVILEEQQRNFANPSVYVWDLANKGLWPNSPMSMSGLGNEYSVSAITRKDILAYKEVLFNEDTIKFITFSPNTEETEINRLIKSIHLPNESQTASLKSKAKHISQKLLLEYRPLNTVFVALSFLLPGVEEVLPSKIALDFIRNYLASGWSSKLIERLRLEKNYTYWVYSDLQLYQEGGCLKISLSSKREHMKDIIQIVREEIEKLRQEKMDETLLKHHITATKAHIVKNYLRPENMLWWYGWNVVAANQIISVGEYLQKLDRLTSEEIMEVAQKYLNVQDLHVAAIGDVQEDLFIL